MAVPPQILADALFTGASLALVASGLALILGVAKVVNLAHGSFFTLGAYVAFVLSARGISHPLPAALLGAGAAFAFGTFLSRSFITPVRSHPFSVAVGTLGFALLFEQAAQLIWGPHPLTIPSGPPARVAFGIVLRPWGVSALLFSGLLLAGYAAFLASRRGLPLKLIAEDEEVAGSVGMDVERIRDLTFGGSCAVAAVAGALLAPASVIYPTMGRAPLILSLLAVIAAGLDRPWACFLVAAVLGAGSTLGAWWLPPHWSYLLLLLGVLLLLAFRPSGLAAVLHGRDY